MNNEREESLFLGTAFRAAAIGPLPESQKNRIRLGEELQPTGVYAQLIPYHRTILDVEALQENERNDPEFRNRDWWWDHQCIRFLNGKVGLKVLLLAIPFIWMLTLLFSGLAGIGFGVLQLSNVFGVPAVLCGLLLIVLVPAWLFFAFWVIPPTTNWIMGTGMGFLLKPFEKSLGNKLDKTLEDGCSEFNRLIGQVRLALGRGRTFEAPFVEFDAYVERVIQQGGIFYRLMLVHRYTQKIFNKTSFSSIEAEKYEVQALWDMLQCYMDVTQPLPDTPRLEPFRHLDPVTAEYDQTTGRNPRYWRDLDLAAWKDGEGLELLQRQREYPWGQRVCKLTPKLGQIDMDTYREQRPVTASVI
ncbi:hypothetical protein [Marinobacter zhejiangensis]|uniref:Uncharacterized protein n=1 Tax=Marinobacter zhejiangensis TaxID=488535 RepID=A0A1I4NL22_9GAMM|nr:hypothetical protein [Marinobacter zhejiangensis]SFM16065.1 hypothetical protein SAMN04487963_1465 [Marinobacter zhejiangensis]